MAATVGDSKFWNDLEKEEEDKKLSEHLEKYEKKYSDLLAELQNSVNFEAENNPDGYRYLINTVQIILLKGFRILRETERNKKKK